MALFKSLNTIHLHYSHSWDPGIYFFCEYEQKKGYCQEDDFCKIQSSLIPNISDQNYVVSTELTKYFSTKL